MENAHDRFERLWLEARIDEISENDRTWMEQHRAGCEACSHRAQLTTESVDDAICGLRSLSVQVDPNLISATRLRVRLHVRELHAKRERMWGLWLLCGFSWVLGVASAPFVWRVFEWIGHEADLPSLIWQAGFVLWWLIPAGVAGAVLAWQRSRMARQDAIQNADY
jgi:hypothetical protein